MEKNAPPDTVMIMCAATSAEGSACSRGMGPTTAAGCVWFVTRTVSLAACQGPSSGVARTDTDPASGSRRRATRAPDSVSCSSPPGITNPVTLGSLSRPEAATMTVTSCSTASSQTGGTAGSNGSSRTRRCTWRKRTVTSTDGRPVCSKTHSACVIGRS